MEIVIFVLFSLAATAAALASPVNFPNPNPKYCDERGEILLLNDLHRTCFRKK